jgi:hypothetical protein
MWTGPPPGPGGFVKRPAPRIYLRISLNSADNSVSLTDHPWVPILESSNAAPIHTVCRVVCAYRRDRRGFGTPERGVAASRRPRRGVPGTLTARRAHVSAGDDPEAVLREFTPRTRHVTDGARQYSSAAPLAPRRTVQLRTRQRQHHRPRSRARGSGGFESRPTRCIAGAAGGRNSNSCCSLGG